MVQAAKGDRNVPDRAHSLEKWASARIRDMIISGELKPGQPIPQNQLAQQLGVSRTPLRRALMELEHEGFVNMEPHSGARVREFSLEEIIGIFEVRCVLEGLVCRLIAPNMRAADTAFLRALITEAAEKERHGDEQAYRAADQEFHSYLADLIDLDIVRSLLPSYLVLSLSFAQGLFRPPTETLPEHLAILGALEAGDSALAEQRMIFHGRRTIKHLRRKLAEGN